MLVFFRESCLVFNIKKRSNADPPQARYLITRLCGRGAVIKHIHINYCSLRTHCSLYPLYPLKIILKITLMICSKKGFFANTSQYYRYYMAIHKKIKKKIKT